MRGKINPRRTLTQSARAYSQASLMVFPFAGANNTAPNCRIPAPIIMRAGISKIPCGSTNAVKNNPGDIPARATFAIKYPITARGSINIKTPNTPNVNIPTTIARAMTRILCSQTIPMPLVEKNCTSSNPWINPWSMFLIFRTSTGRGNLSA